MDKTYSYQIITNVNGRHILIINKLIDIDREPSLHDEEFDAIYINISHRSYEENRLIVRWTSPMRGQEAASMRRSRKETPVTIRETLSEASTQRPSTQ